MRNLPPEFPRLELFDKVGACTAATPTSIKPMTLDGLKAILEVLKPPPCPLAAWMTRQGFDPKERGVLFLPTRLRAIYGDCLPPYIRYSNVVTDAVLARDPLIQADASGDSYFPIVEVQPGTIANIEDIG
jgi:hypothetical protein